MALAKVKLEIVPWLTDYFGFKGSRRLVLEEGLEDGATLRDLLMRLADQYQGLAELFFDPEGQELSGQISIIVNDRMLELVGGLETRIDDGARIMLLPAFDGG